MRPPPIHCLGQLEHAPLVCVHAEEGDEEEEEERIDLFVAIDGNDIGRLQVGRVGGGGICSTQVPGFPFSEFCPPSLGFFEP